MDPRQKKPMWCCSNCGRPIVAVGTDAQDKLAEHKKASCPSATFKAEERAAA